MIEIMTYQEALKLAHEISIGELQDLLERDDNPTIYRSRKHRRIAMDAKFHPHPDGCGSVLWTHCNKNGDAEEDSVFIGSKWTTPVFEFCSRGTLYVKVRPVEA